MANLRYDSASLTLLTVLFRRFVSEENLDTVQMEGVKISQFLQWVNKQPALFDGDEWESLKAKHGVSTDDMEFLQEVFKDPMLAVKLLLPRWWLLTLASRAAPQQKLAHVGIRVYLEFEDGIKFDYVASAPALMICGGAITDASLFTPLDSQLEAMVDCMAKAGLDKIYEWGLDRSRGLPVNPVLAPVHRTEML